MSEMVKPSIVLVHGIWADASCFNKVIPALQEDGYEVVAPHCNLDTLAGDVEAVRQALRRVTSPAILVGHSYGGAVITAAGINDRVAGLIYLAGLAPDADETCQSLQDKFPTSNFRTHTEIADGRWWLRAEAVAYLANDLPERKRKLIWSTQSAPSADLFDQKVEGTAWATKPSWYVVARDDRIAHPNLQRFVAQRMKATVFEAPGGHISMLSDPDLVIRVIREAARATATPHQQTRNAPRSEGAFV